MWPRCNIGTQSISNWSHCLAAWPDTKCLEQTLSFSSLSSVRSSRLMAEIHARLLLVVNSFVLNNFRNTTKFHYRILFLWTFSTLVAAANNNAQNHGNNERCNIYPSQFKSINTVSGRSRFLSWDTITAHGTVARKQNHVSENTLYQGRTMYFESFGCWEPLQRNTFLPFSSVYLLALPYFVLCLWVCNQGYVTI